MQSPFSSTFCVFLSVRSDALVFFEFLAYKGDKRFKNLKKYNIKTSMSGCGRTNQNDFLIYKFDLNKS